MILMENKNQTKNKLLPVANVLNFFMSPLIVMLKNCLHRQSRQQKM
jgi:hypothetical protein